MKAALPGFSMFVCTLALADPKGAHECIGEERLDLGHGHGEVQATNARPAGRGLR